MPQDDREIDRFEPAGPTCRSEDLVYMGQLGDLHWHRCANCGQDVSVGDTIYHLCNVMEEVLA